VLLTISRQVTFYATFNGGIERPQDCHRIAQVTLNSLLLFVEKAERLKVWTVARESMLTQISRTDGNTLHSKAGGLGSMRRQRRSDKRFVDRLPAKTAKRICDEYNPSLDRSECDFVPIAFELGCA
jgi:hypothetical protein